MPNALFVENNRESPLPAGYISQLQGLDISLEFAHSFQQASEKLQASKFDCILLDINLPDKTTPEAITKFHKLAPKIPIIVFPDIKDETIEHTAIALGAQDFLYRSQTTPVMLVQTIKHALDRASFFQTTIDRQKAELDSAVKNLQAFTYFVSHDLRAPLVGIDGFSSLLLEEYQEKLDSTAREYLQRVRKSTTKMGKIINDLLLLAQVSNQEVHRSVVNLSRMTCAILKELSESEPQRRVEQVVEPNLHTRADVNLMEIALTNLLDNAWKFTHKAKEAHIEFGAVHRENQTIYYVRDNGIGFDSKSVTKLFQPFQRLHHDTELEGTGIGLSIVDRIIRQHAGSIWAEATTGKGAAFYFTLSNSDTTEEVR